MDRVKMAYDVLEQITDDYLQRRGYFTRLNVRFRPDKTDPQYVALEDNQGSDIDVLAVKPTCALDDPKRVLAVSCKSNQSGFFLNQWLTAVHNDRRYNGKVAWKHVRELWSLKWARAHAARVKELTGAERYTVVLAIAAGVGPVDRVVADPTVTACLGQNSLEVLTLAQMWDDLRTNTTKTVEASDIGRLAQMLNAADVH
jgi:hypothetical protein